MAATVADIVDRLGPTLVVGAGGAVDKQVVDLLVTEPVYPATIAPHALVAVLGLRIEEEKFGELRRTASAAGAAGLVIKGQHVPELGDDDLAVVVVEPGADWVPVITLLQTASALGGLTVHPDDSLFGLADAIASLCGGSVVLYDSAWQLIAYSGQPGDEVRKQTIVGRRAPVAAFEGLSAAGVLDALARGEVVEVPDGQIEGMGRRFAVAARAGDELLATIWLQPGGDGTLADVADGLRRAGEVATLTLLREFAVGPTGVRIGDAAFTAQLAGQHTERVVAERLGADVDGGFVLAGLRPTTTDERDRAATARRLALLTRSHCAAYRVSALVATGVDTAYLIFSANDASERQRAVRVITDMQARLQMSAPHRTVVSSKFDSLATTQSIRVTVDDLLSLAERRGWSGLTDSDEVQASWRLEQFREVALAHPALLSGPVVRLAEHDRAHGTKFVATLRAYFDSVGDMKVAADRLGVHVNTVRYRVGRAQEIVQFSLERPDERLLAELQVRLLTS